MEPGDSTSRAERRRQGKALRTKYPRASQGEWKPVPSRRTSSGFLKNRMTTELQVLFLSRISGRPSRHSNSSAGLSTKPAKDTDLEFSF
jgi:hypothetical protein